MKNQEKVTKSPFLFLLLFALVFLFLPSLVIANQNSNQSTTELNQNELTLNSEQRILSSIQTLNQSLTTLESQTNSQENSKENSEELLRLHIDQMNDLRLLKTQWITLQTLSRELRKENRELANLLQECWLIIENLERRLASATQGVEDAIENWWHMETLLDQSDLAIVNWNRDYQMLHQQYLITRRGAVIGFTVGGVSFGVGVPLMVEGLKSNNDTMLWSGVGVTIIPTAIWALGHFIFQWW